MSKHPPILIVDENDNQIGSAPRSEIQQRGLLHRIAQVMVEDPKGRVLLQKRAATSEYRPNCWDTSVGGHVDEGEDYLGAALREMSEEIGLIGVELQEIGAYRKDSVHEWRQLNRFYKVYKTVVPAKTEFKLAPDEVSEVRWFTVDQVKKLIAQDQDKFTGGIIETINRFYV